MALGLCAVLRSTTHSSEILPALQTSPVDLETYLRALENLPDDAVFPDEDLAQERADCRLLLTGLVPPSLSQVPTVETVETLLKDDLFADLTDCLIAPVVCPVELRQLLTRLYTGTPKTWTSVYPLLFYTRDPVAGLNKRDVFKTFLKALYHLDPAGTQAVLPDIPVVGCWRDVYQLLRDPSVPVPLFEDLLDLVVQGFQTARRGAKVVEYAPRENKHRVLAGILARALYPEERLYSTRMKLYRNCLADLTGLPGSHKLNSAAVPFRPQGTGDPFFLIK